MVFRVEQQAFKETPGVPLHGVLCFSCREVPGELQFKHGAFVFCGMKVDFGVLCGDFRQARLQKQGGVLHDGQEFLLTLDFQHNHASIVQLKWYKNPPYMVFFASQSGFFVYLSGCNFNWHNTSKENVCGPLTYTLHCKSRKE